VVKKGGQAEGSSFGLKFNKRRLVVFKILPTNLQGVSNSPIDGIFKGTPFPGQKRRRNLVSQGRA